MTQFSTNPFENAARLFPGGDRLLKPVIGGVSGAVERGAQTAAQFRSFARNLGGAPAELPAGVMGAAFGAVGGFFTGSLSGLGIESPWRNELSEEPVSEPPAREQFAPPIIAPTPQPQADPEPAEPEPAQTSDLPRSVRIPFEAASEDTMEEVFSLYLLGDGVFSEDPAYLSIQVDMYELNGTWAGFFQGLQLNRSNPLQLFKPPVSGEGLETPPRVEVTEWTNGYYAFANGSALTTHGIARSHLIPLQNGALLFTITNNHIVSGGTGIYEGVSGVKQGIGSLYVPPGEFLTNFPSAGYRIVTNSIDTFRLIKKPFIRPIDPIARANSKTFAVTQRSALTQNPLLQAHNEAAFRLPLPENHRANPLNYDKAQLFRRLGQGEGVISADRKRFRFQGDFREMDHNPCGHFEGVYELTAPITEGDLQPLPAPLPYTLETLSIDQLQTHAICEQHWSFDDGRTLTASGQALIRTAPIITGEQILWFSVSQIISSGGGEFEGARGVQTTGLAISIPAGVDPGKSVSVTFKSIDCFVILPEEYVGKIELPEPPGPPQTEDVDGYSEDPPDDDSWPEDET